MEKFVDYGNEESCLNVFVARRFFEWDFVFFDWVRFVMSI